MWGAAVSVIAENFAVAELQRSAWLPQQGMFTGAPQDLLCWYMTFTDACAAVAAGVPGMEHTGLARPKFEALCGLHCADDGGTPRWV